MKPKLLNIREHLKHIALILDWLQKYGYCPAIQDEVRRAKVFNKAILKKHEENKAKGNRKDIRS